MLNNDRTWLYIQCVFIYNAILINNSPQDSEKLPIAIT